MTVLADTTMQADALSTAAFILGPDKGFALLEQLPNVDGVMVVRRDTTPEALDIRVARFAGGNCIALSRQPCHGVRANSNLDNTAHDTISDVW